MGLFAVALLAGFFVWGGAVAELGGFDEFFEVAEVVAELGSIGCGLAGKGWGWTWPSWLACSWDSPDGDWESWGWPLGAGEGWLLELGVWLASFGFGLLCRRGLLLVYEGEAGRWWALGSSDFSLVRACCSPSLGSSPVGTFEPSVFRSISSCTSLRSLSAWALARRRASLGSPRTCLAASSMSCRMPERVWAASSRGSLAWGRNWRLRSSEEVLRSSLSFSVGRLRRDS